MWCLEKHWQYGGAACASCVSVELRGKDLVGNAGRAHRPTDIVQPVYQFSFVGALVACGFCAGAVEIPDCWTISAHWLGSAACSSVTERRGRTTLAGKARRPVVLPKFTYFASHFGIFFGDHAVYAVLVRASSWSRIPWS